ncbi:site-specific integrase [Rhodoferax sp. 4810]|nr:site-specific integrase [Rhodoferax jenense]
MAYDLQNKSIVNEIVDYSIYQIGKLGLSPLTVHQVATCLARFVDFLLTENITYLQVHDGILAKFRDKELRVIVGTELLSHVSNDAIMRAKSTVNQKMQAVLAWLCWLADTGRLPSYMIGPHHKLITLESKIVTRGSSSRQYTLSKLSSPVLFTRISRSTGQRVGRTPQDEQLTEIKNFLASETDSTYIKRRNLLLFDIAITTGFRRASISSLRCAQFNREEILFATEEYISLRPDKQKFSYGNEFQISTELALRILEYIEGPLTYFCLDKRVGVGVANSRLFLSEKNGMPLDDRSITAIFSKAMRQAGMPKGCSIHALRRRFADEEIVKVILFRLQHGLDTSAISIAQEVAQKLGHRSLESITAYVSSNQSRLLASGMKKVDF